MFNKYGRYFNSVIQKIRFVNPIPKYFHYICYIMILEQIIVEILKTKEASIEELSAFTGINPGVVKDVLERLVSLGIIEETPSEFIFT